MEVDATEGVVEHSWLLPHINLHVPVTAFMFGCSGSDVKFKFKFKLYCPVQSIEF